MHGQGMAVGALIVGIILILLSFTTINPLVVIGALLIIKALIMFFIPGCCKEKAKPVAKPARRR